MLARATQRKVAVDKTKRLKIIIGALVVMQVVMLMWAAGLTAWVRTGYENERTLSSDAHRMRVHLIEAGILDVDGQTLVARCPWERSEENPEAICSQEWRAVIDPDYED